LSLSLGAPNNYPAIAKTHWDENDPNHTRCGFPINYSFALLAAFKAVDSSNVEHSFFMLYDPKGRNVNLSTFTGRFSGGQSSDSVLSDNMAEASGQDLSTLEARGLFFIEKDELSSCFLEYAIAHERSSDGYFQRWIDVEGVTEGASNTYTVEIE
jgi:hypothetical protein